MVYLYYSAATRNYFYHVPRGLTGSTEYWRIKGKRNWKLAWKILFGIEGLGLRFWRGWRRLKRHLNSDVWLVELRFRAPADV